MLFLRISSLTLKKKHLDMAMNTREPIIFHGNVFILKTVFIYFHRTLKIDSEFQSRRFIIFDRLIHIQSTINNAFKYEMIKMKISSYKKNAHGVQMILI